jgi:hypothetical protein
VNGFLLVAVTVDELLPAGFFATREEADEAALMLTAEEVARLSRMVYLNNHPGEFVGPWVAEFRHGKPVEVVPYPTIVPEEEWPP